MKINKKLKTHFLKIEKLKEEEKNKFKILFGNLIEKYPIHEIITANEFRKIIIDIYKKREDEIIKIELENEEIKENNNTEEIITEDKNSNEESEHNKEEF